MDNVMHKCSECGKEAKTRAGLAAHMRGHKPTEYKLPNKIEAVPMRTLTTNEPAKPVYDIEKYKQLPPPIVNHLKMVFGNWLNYFEIGQEYKDDFGGYGMYIKVPQQFSTEWQETVISTYDNVTMKLTGTKKTWIPDVRWKSLKDEAEAKEWINLVKRYIIDHAYRKGIALPSTNTGVDQAKQTKEEYVSAIAGTRS